MTVHTTPLSNGHIVRRAFTLNGPFGLHLGLCCIHLVLMVHDSGIGSRCVQMLSFILASQNINIYYDSC